MQGIEIATKDFAEFIKGERIKRGLSVSEVAKKVGFSESYLYNLERGTRKASEGNIGPILNFYGYDWKIKVGKSGNEHNIAGFE